MGTRSYSDDDTESEKRRKTERYAQTTSLSLGTRICGMQVSLDNCCLTHSLIDCIIVLVIITQSIVNVVSSVYYTPGIRCYLTKV